MKVEGSDDPCLGANSNGIEYREFACRNPILEPFYLSFEKYYDPIPGLEWMTARPWLPIVACVLYVVLIFGGQAYMKDQPRWHWRQTLAAWNLGLSLFSLLGMLRTLPHLLHNLWTYSLYDNMCVNPEMDFGSGSTGLWAQLFILSKFPELLDTFFIVIHKKPLIFLHWYHHITVLLYCWHSYVTKTPPGKFFIVMNYSVHAAMYFYYFLMAARCKPAWLDPMVITGLQISQMIVGVIVTCLGFYFYDGEQACAIKAQNNTAAFVMYGSYLFLFLQFFVGRYAITGDKKKATTKTDKTDNGDKTKQPEAAKIKRV